MPIEDLARSDVVTAPPDTSIESLAATMDEESVGSVVVTRDDVPAGIVTDRDLTVRVLAAARDPTDLTARDVMTEDLCTVQRGDGFYEAATTMAENGVRRLPVCEGESLEGIITADDLTELLADEQQHLADLVRAQRPEY
ncbi:CBS domain-containing protein [Haloarchaeobius salinus]|uniref:CBS domain-containing protein n=1 Tax=Haloarchaeobius salinus TaxID=1198298 RepID=UPI00210A0E4F|nr:CBS domain-containing protein [Haloarchaeobius salinus]